MIAYLLREYFTTHTLGVFVVVDAQQNIVMSCSVLELPWVDNKPQVSCIPEKTYKVIERYSEKHKRHYHIQSVPNRELILQHAGNFTRQIRGCQLPGVRFKHMDKDEIPDIESTRSTLDKMLNLLGKEYTLIITSVKKTGYLGE